MLTFTFVLPLPMFTLLPPRPLLPRVSPSFPERFASPLLRSPPVVPLPVPDALPGAVPERLPECWLPPLMVERSAVLAPVLGFPWLALPLERAWLPPPEGRAEEAPRPPPPEEE